MTEPESTAGDSRKRGADNTQPGWCVSTSWTVLTLAAQSGSPGAEKALEELCRRYWTPVYAYIRRRGHDVSEAEDLTQSFIASFLHTRTLSRLDESKGRFRSLLLVSIRNFLSNEWERSQAQKRGGGRPVVSLDEMEMEERYCATAPELSPDALYDKRWALAVLGQALALLERDEVKRGRAVQFRHLQVFLTAKGTDENRRAAAADLGMSPEAVAMAVSRLTRRFRETLRRQIAATVEPEQVEEELRCLKAALRGR